MKRITRILAVLCIIFATSFFGFIDKAHALPSNGITAELYNCPQYGAQPPRPCNPSPILTTTVSNINFNWGGGSVLGGSADQIEVKFTGYIMSPTTINASFRVDGDDGQYFRFNNQDIITNCWVDKGGGVCNSQQKTLQANTYYPFTYWFYENGGGAAAYLYWNTGSGYQTIPSNMFYLTNAPAPSLNAPTSLTATAESDGINLTWAAPAPTEENTAVERYAVSWSTSNFTTNGWGIASQTTSILIPYETINSTNGRGKEYQFKIRADNDTLSVYSGDSNVVSIYVPSSAPTISLTPLNNSIQVSASHPDANTWFYQVLTSQQGCSNPYDQQTLNTENHPATFTINNLQNGCLYQVKVANWTGAVNLYASATTTPQYIPAPLPFTPQNTINENDSLIINAPEGKLIDQITAWYGDPNDGNFGLNVSNLLTQQFTNLTTATFNATNQELTDPVPGVGKVLIISVTYKNAPEPTPSPNPSDTPAQTSPTPTPSPSEPSPTPSPEPQQPPEPPVTPVPPSPQPPTPEPPPVRPPDPIVVPPVVEPTPEPTPEPDPEPEVPVEPEQPIDETPIDTPDLPNDTELDPVIVPEDLGPIEDQLLEPEDPVQDNTETEVPQETIDESPEIQDDSQDNSSDTIEQIIQQEVERVAEEIGLSEKDAKLLAELVKSDPIIAQAVQEFSQRTEANANAPMPYTLADVATEIQAEQVVAGLTEAFTDPAAAFAGAAESFAELANFAGDLLSNPAEALASLGSDMTDDQREKAQEVIIPVIIVSQVVNAIASMLSARRM